MNFETARKLLANDIVEAFDAGKLYGNQEVELYIDQNGGFTYMRPWIWFQYQGNIPYDDDDPRRDAFDFVVDYVASMVWNKAVDCYITS